MNARSRRTAATHPIEYLSVGVNTMAGKTSKTSANVAKKAPDDPHEIATLL